jgi:hypothetical protein
MGEGDAIWLNYYRLISVICLNFIDDILVNMFIIILTLFRMLDQF